MSRALLVNRETMIDPLGVLAAVGGLEIAALAGVVIGAAECGVAVVSDGFISGAATLAALRLCPAAREYVIPSHLSAEPGHGVLLDAMGLDPVFDLEHAPRRRHGRCARDGGHRCGVRDDVGNGHVRRGRSGRGGGDGDGVSRAHPLRDAGLAISLLTVLPTRARMPDDGTVPQVAGWFPAVGLLLGAAAYALVHAGEVAAAHRSSPASADRGVWWLRSGRC